MLELSQRRTNTRSTSKIYGQRRRTTQNIGETPWRTSRRRRGQTHCALSSTRVVGRGVGSVTKRLRSSTAAKVHGSASWHGMTCECAHRLHLVEASATALLLVSCTHRGSGQGCPETFLLRFPWRLFSRNCSWTAANTSSSTSAGTGIVIQSSGGTSRTETARRGCTGRVRWARSRGRRGSRRVLPNAAAP